MVAAPTDFVMARSKIDAIGICVRVLLLGWFFLARFDTFVVWIHVVVFDEYAVSPEGSTGQCTAVRLCSPTIHSLYSHPPCTHCNTTVHSLQVHFLHSNRAAGHFQHAVIVQSMHTEIQSMYNQRTSCSLYSQCTPNAHHAAFIDSRYSSQCSPCSLVSCLATVAKQPIEVLRSGCWQRLCCRRNQ